MYTSEFCSVRFLDEINVALVTWKKFTSGREYRLPLMYAAGLMTARKGSNFVADTRDGFEDDPADTQWIFDNFIPSLRLTDCKHVFFIIDRDAALREELEAQKGELKNYFEVHACYDLDEVKAILKDAAK